MRGYRSVTATMAGLALLAAGLTGVAPGHAQPAPDFVYVEVSDGVKIAVHVSFPSGFDPAEQYPALFRMNGYAGAAIPDNPAWFDHRYVMVIASIRGTGCSGGDFELFSDRSHQDGYEIIEDWIVEQPWSNGKVGITGHSYSGLTGFYVASLNPPSVRATAVSGLIDDYYRGILRMGGIPNPGFPILWTGGSRPVQEWSAHTSRYLSGTMGGSAEDRQCAEHLAGRMPWNLIAAREMALFYAEMENRPGTWTSERSPVVYAPSIAHPIHLQHQYQDEQTGPRGLWLWTALRDDIPKRMTLTNARHGRITRAQQSKVAWLDCWVIRDGQDCPGDTLDPDARIRVHFETVSLGTGGTNPPLATSDFPLPETAWDRLYLRADGSLSTDPPAAGEPGASYVSTPAGREVSAEIGSSPDHVAYELAFTQDTAIMGPMTLTLWATSSAPDTDFFVEVSDITPNGDRQPLQRGMLRASHREVDEDRSDRVTDGPHAGEIIRPHHPHVDPFPVIPGEPTEYLIEIFPVGHVFRAGHTMRVSIHTPPPVDPISEWYTYGTVPAPAVNTVLHDTDHPSSLLVPFLPAVPPIHAQAPGCGDQVGVRCLRPRI